MKLIHTIVKEDVRQGVYRHPMGSAMRKLLVSIHDKFGGIGPKDVGVKVFISNGELIWGNSIK